jgi:Tfp pilus assembly protein PilF
MAINDNLNTFDDCIKCGLSYVQKEDVCKEDIINAQVVFMQAIYKARTNEQESLGHYNVGVTHAQLYDYQQACFYFGRALELDPNNTLAIQMLEMILRDGDIVSRSMAEKYLGYKKNIFY